MTDRKIEGWPDTDPYPFRGFGKWPPQEDETDCAFVARDREYAKTAKVGEMGDYAYIMRVAWQHINEQAREIAQLKKRIQWLNNVGGEHLNLATGIDIVCRDLVLKKRAQKESACGEAEHKDNAQGQQPQPEQHRE